MSVNTTLVSGHKIIIDPEGVGEVCGVLGTNHADVGWVCSRATLINKWAKYKPVKNTDNNYQSQLITSGTNKNKWQSGATWWKASDGKCGLIINKRTTGSALATNWGTDWGYDAITINASNVASHWCRLTDFNYYDHNANVPVYIGYPSEYVINANQNLEITFQAYNGNDYQLMLTDVTTGVWNSQSSMYCGVLVVWGTPNTSYTNKQKVTIVHSTPLGTNLTNYGKYTRVVSVPYANLPTITPNEITIYPFLYNGIYNNGNPTQKGANEDVGWTNGVIACPVDSATIEAVAAYISGALSNVTCTYGQGGNSVQVVCTYAVTGHHGFSMSNLEPFLYVLDNDIDTEGLYPDYEKMYGRHIISYGTATNNPLRGYSMSVSADDGVTLTYTQATLFNNATNYATIGIDAASYVEQYRAKHGSGAAKVTLVMEFHDSSDRAYGSVTMADVTVSGTY